MHACMDVYDKTINYDKPKLIKPDARLVHACMHVFVCLFVCVFVHLSAPEGINSQWIG